MPSANRDREAPADAGPRRPGHESDAATPEAKDRIPGSVELLRQARVPETAEDRDRGFAFTVDPASMAREPAFYPGADPRPGPDLRVGADPRVGPDPRADAELTVGLENSANPDEPVPDDPARLQPKRHGNVDDAPP